jgi:hypothetical protein
MCKSKAKAQNVNMVKYENDYENESNVWSLWTKKTVNTIKNMFIPLITLFLCQTVVSFAVDTGAQVNIIDEKTYNKLKLKPNLQKCKTTLFSYNSSKPIETLGQFETRILLIKRYHKIEFIVAKGCAGNLISYPTSVEIGILNEIKQLSRTDTVESDGWKMKFKSK